MLLFEYLGGKSCRCFSQKSILGKVKIEDRVGDVLETPWETLYEPQASHFQIAGAHGCKLVPPFRWKCLTNSSKFPYVKSARSMQISITTEIN